MRAFKNLAQKNKLSLGVTFPIESYKGSIPKMENQEKLAKRAEELGFKALWFRDVPFNDPKFGDAGQLYDPFVYMAHIMNQTQKIALASGSIILPLRHPVHTAKALFSLQKLSGGRIVMGIASGDRAIEYPAFNKDINKKSELFRESFYYLKKLQEDFPTIESHSFGSTNGAIDLEPKTTEKTAMLVTGFSGQSLDWIAANGDGWLYYPRNFAFLQQSMANWTAALQRNEQNWKPYMQSLYIDLAEDRDSAPSPIHLGFRSGYKYLNDYFQQLEMHGVNHVAINLKFSSRPVELVLEELGERVLPFFSGT